MTSSWISPQERPVIRKAFPWHWIIMPAWRFNVLYWIFEAHISLKRKTLHKIRIPFGTPFLLYFVTVKPLADALYDLSQKNPQKTLHSSPLCLHPYHLPSPWINHMPSKVWNEITYPFTNLNGCIVDVWERVSKFIPHIGCNCSIIWGLKVNHVSKRLNVRSLETTASFMTSWWRHQMETVSMLLDLYAGNSPAIGEFPSQRPVMRSFDIWINSLGNNREAGDLRRHRAHEDVTVMILVYFLLVCYTWISKQWLVVIFSFHFETTFVHVVMFSQKLVFVCAYDQFEIVIF